MFFIAKIVILVLVLCVGKEFIEEVKRMTSRRH